MVLMKKNINCKTFQSMTSDSSRAKRWCVLNYFQIIFLFSFSISSLFSQFSTTPGAGKPTVAILDFEGRGVSPQEVQTLSERMRTEIGNTNAVRLIERKAVDKIMQEQGFQQSGCTTDECASEVGQLLGVQYMISGAIGLMGKTYTIDAKMFSVETGETVRTKSVSHKGDISGLLIEMQIMAWEIVGLQAPARLLLYKTGGAGKITVAVLDFEGRGISVLEAQTLTDRFNTEMSGTDKVIMVERGTMMDVLNEQGFEAGSCTSDECAAEVGAMLGVEFMVTGAIGKLGETYTIDVKMFSVATGAAENMESVTYVGKVDGLITEIEILAWEIMELDPPKALLKKQKRRGGVAAAEGGTNWLLWGLVGVAAIGGGAALALSGDSGAAAVSDIGEPPAFPTVP